MATKNTSGALSLNGKALIIGAILIGAGSIISITGLAISSASVMAAASRRVKEMEVPPSEIARQKWSQLKAATTAGAGAWRNGTPVAS